jgi:hypothetical protein
MAIVNLTPHAINLVGDNPQNFPPSGTVARCAVTRQQVGTVDGVPVNRTVYGDVTGLPAPQPGTYYIVSALVAQAVPDRTDVLITDDAVRDDAGRIIGCRALATLRGDALTANTNSGGGFGQPMRLDAGSMITPAQVALADAVMAAAVRDRSPDADHMLLADVAASHRQILADLPDGFTVDSPTYCLGRATTESGPSTWSKVRVYIPWPSVRTSVARARLGWSPQSTGRPPSTTGCSIRRPLVASWQRPARETVRHLGATANTSPPLYNPTFKRRYHK